MNHSLKILINDGKPFVDIYDIGCIFENVFMLYDLKYFLLKGCLYIIFVFIMPINNSPIKNLSVANYSRVPKKMKAVQQF